MSSKLDNFFDINDNTKRERSNFYNIFMIFIVLIINFFILYCLIKIQKCKCANIKESFYLKEWYIFKVIYLLIYLLSYSFYNKSEIFMYINIIIVIIEFIMIIRLLLYIHKLKKLKCHCKMSIEQNIIYYYYIVIFSIFLLFILTLILFSIFSFINK